MAPLICVLRSIANTWNSYTVSLLIIYTPTELLQNILCKANLSMVMEHLKNHNTGRLCPSDSSSSKSGTKSSRPSHNKHSRTTTSRRRQVADNSSPERRPCRTHSLDDYHSRHYRRHSFSPVHCSSGSRRRDCFRSREISKSPLRREKEIRPRVEHQEDRPTVLSSMKMGPQADTVKIDPELNTWTMML